jgi:2-polyprenyl-3-methyl-5-hydroxy-6-metoxy-1,4-benzoquinol methylase
MTDTSQKKGTVAEQIAAQYYATTASRAHQRDVGWYEHASYQKLLRFSRWLPADRNARILEIGCGCGEMLYGLEKKGYKNLVGLDYCREELDEAAHFVSAELVCDDAQKFLDETKHEYDLVIAYNVLEHFSKESLLEMLRNIRKVLKPGGALIAMVPNAVSPFAGTSRYWDITHELAFTTNSWRQLASLVGFDEVDFRECGPVPHGVVSSIRYALWQAIRLMIKFYMLVEVASDRGGLYTQDMLVKLSVKSTD